MRRHSGTKLGARPGTVIFRCTCAADGVPDDLQHGQKVNMGAENIEGRVEGRFLEARPLPSGKVRLSLEVSPGEADRLMRSSLKVSDGRAARRG